jgi:hypothetical protein
MDLCFKCLDDACKSMTIQLTTKQSAMKQLVLALPSCCEVLRYRRPVYSPVKHDLFTAFDINSNPEFNEDENTLWILNQFSF